MEIGLVNSMARLVLTGLGHLHQIQLMELAEGAFNGALGLAFEDRQVGQLCKRVADPEWARRIAQADL